jgi:CheY-like chemotaxis protein
MLYAHDLGLSYQLILMDFSMPEMGGIETTKKIKKFVE